MLEKQLGNVYGCVQPLITKDLVGLVEIQTDLLLQVSIPNY